MTSVPMPPTSTAGTAPIQRRHRAGAEFAELIRRADEQAVHRRDAAAHRVRRAELHQRHADHDAHHVGGAEHRERGERDDEMCSTARTRRSRARSPRPPRTSSFRRRARSASASARAPCVSAPTRGRGAQQAERPRAGREHVAREHRQQRRDAAEQHREQIERDDAEASTGLRRMNAKPAKKTFRRDRLARRRRALDADQQRSAAPAAANSARQTP